MKVTLLNRKVHLIHCRKKEDILKWLMRNDYDTTYERNISNFMESYAARKRLFDNMELRIDSVDHFVDDLVKNKIISIS
ncbi:MAG: hypothetical protein QM640_04870 [Niabella sp.]